MILTFKDFLEEEKKSRLQVMDVSKAVSWMSNHCDNYLDGGTFLFRGSKTYPKGISTGDSSVGEARKSANTVNYYTLWFDNNPMFKGWPKRGHAFICTTDNDNAKKYGPTAIVVPADNAKVGIVGKLDLWGIEVKPDFFINDMNEFTHECFRKKGIIVDTYSELISALKKMKRADVDGDLLKHMESSNAATLYDLWSDLLNQSIFKGHTTAGSNLKGNGEMWVEGRCLFIPTDQDTVPTRVQYEIGELAQDYPKFERVLRRFWNETEPEEDSDDFDTDDWGDDDDF